MRVVSDRDRAKPSPGTRLHIRELADLVGASCDDIQRYIDARILTTDARGRLTSQAVDIVRFGLMLEAKGMDIRHVRAIRHSAHSHAANIVTMLATERTKNTPLAKNALSLKLANLQRSLTIYIRRFCWKTLTSNFANPPRQGELDGIATRRKRIKDVVGKYHVGNTL